MKRKQVCSNDESSEKNEKVNRETPPPPPLYESKKYWEERYKSHRSYYSQKLRELTDTNEAKIMEETTFGKDGDSNQQSNATKTSPFHSWYLTYEELVPLLYPLIAPSTDSTVTSSERKSIFEIGCGDVPLGSSIQDDVKFREYVSKIICCDCSSTVIDFLKQMQNLSVQARTKSDLNLPIPILEYVLADAQQLPYPDKSFDIVLDKGTLDAVLSDKIIGISNCVRIVSEIVRVLTKIGIILFVSHMNAKTANGLSWLQEAIIPGLLKCNKDLNWSIEAHGAADENEYEDESDEIIYSSPCNEENDVESHDSVHNEEVESSNDSELNEDIHFIKELDSSKDITEDNDSISVAESFESFPDDAKLAYLSQGKSHDSGPTVYIIRMLESNDQSKYETQESSTPFFFSPGVSLSIISY